VRYTPGSTATFYAPFIDEAGNPKDPDSVTVDVTDANGTEIVTDGVPTQDALGAFHFDLDLAEDAPWGLWSINWTAIFDGNTVPGREDFEVAFDFVVLSNVLLHSTLRSRLGEVSKLPADQNGSDTMFLTEEISEILSLTNNDLDRATLEGWQRKAGHLQRLIDFNEAGTERNLSRKFIQAKQMQDYWLRVVSQTGQIRSTALAGRVVGKVIHLRSDAPSAPVLTGLGAMNERMWPVNRSWTLMIPAILQ